jgi:hypothetical protein
MVDPLACCGPQPLDDLHFDVELTATSLITEGHRHPGLAACNASARILG